MRIDRRMVAGLVAAAVVAAALTSAEATSGRGPAVRPVAVPAEDRQAVLDGNAEFAFDSYARLAASPGNVVYSPLSVSTAAAMIMAGAKAETRAQLASALHLGLAPQDVDAAFQSALASLRPRNRGVVLEIANALWTSDQWRFRPGFASLLRRSYGAPAKPIDFIGHPVDAANAINRWASQRTHGMIPSVLRPDAITPDTVAILANAVYLNAKWARPFPRRATTDDVFLTAAGTQVPTPMMSQRGTLAFYADPDAFDFGPSGGTASASSVEVVELPYRGRDYAMLVILPATRDGLPAVEAQFTAAKLQSWIEGLAPADVDVSLPRFEMESSLDLVDTMKALGATDVFDDQGRADLSGMAGLPGELYLKILAQKAKIRVHESGTEAAAVTVGGFMESGSVHSSMPFPFHVDHPFLFVIRHKPTGTILFMGRVEDPTAAPR